MIVALGAGVGGHVHHIKCYYLHLGQLTVLQELAQVNDWEQKKCKMLKMSEQQGAALQ